MSCRETHTTIRRDGKTETQTEMRPFSWRSAVCRAHSTKPLSSRNRAEHPNSSPSPLSLTPHISKSFLLPVSLAHHVEDIRLVSLARDPQQRAPASGQVPQPDAAVL